jgi:hypothetical protein
MATLPNKWNYNKPPIQPLFLKIGVLSTDLIGNVLPGSAHNMALFFSLYSFILHNIDVPAAELRQRITMDGKPLFTPEQMELILKTVNSQRESSFAKRLLRMTGGTSMIGGGPFSSIPKLATVGSVTSKFPTGDSVIPKLPTVNVVSSAIPKLPTLNSNATPTSAPTASSTASPITSPTEANSKASPSNDSAMPQSPLDNDPSRSKFWDVFIRTRLYNLTKGLPPAFDGFAPIIFALYSLEQIEVLGPLIASALDSVTLGLPILGKLMGTALAKIISLAPIPYAGPVGDIAAYFICLVFIMLSATMSVSRKQFGTSFTVGVGAVPIIGDNLSDAALLFEKQVERYEFNKKKFLDSLDKVSPHTAEFIDYWLPSKTPKSGPPVVFDPDEVMLDVFKKLVTTEGEDKAMLSTPNPEILPVKARDLVSNPEYKSKIGSKAPKKSGGRRRTRRLRR